MAHLRRLRVLAASLAALLLGLSFPGWPQTSESKLKAAYTLNFAKFTHWPAGRGGASSGALRVCADGTSDIGPALEESANTRVAGRTLEVRYVRLPGDVLDCDLLYISTLDLSRARRQLAAMAAYPILTVSDVQDFAQSGGMIELLLVDRKLRFEIDLDAVRAAGLRLDPKLLDLAIRVYGH